MKDERINPGDRLEIRTEVDLTARELQQDAAWLEEQIVENLIGIQPYPTANPLPANSTWPPPFIHGVHQTDISYNHTRTAVQNDTVKQIGRSYEPTDSWPQNVGDSGFNGPSYEPQTPPKASAWVERSQPTAPHTAQQEVVGFEHQTKPKNGHAALNGTTQ